MRLYYIMRLYYDIKLIVILCYSLFSMSPWMIDFIIYCIKDRLIIMNEVLNQLNFNFIVPYKYSWFYNQ